MDADIIVWLRRRGAVPGVTAADTALRSGQLPEDAEPDELRAGLLHVERGLRVAQRWSVAIWTSCALAWATVLQPSIIGAGAWWLVLVVCLVVGIGTVVSIRRQRRRVDRLLADLSVRTR